MELRRSPSGILRFKANLCSYYPVCSIKLHLQMYTPRSFLPSTLFRDPNNTPNSKKVREQGEGEEPLQMCLGNYNPREDYESDPDTDCARITS